MAGMTHNLSELNQWTGAFLMAILIALIVAVRAIDQVANQIAELRHELEIERDERKPEVYSAEDAGRMNSED